MQSIFISIAEKNIFYLNLLYINYKNILVSTIDFLQTCSNPLLRRGNRGTTQLPYTSREI